MFLRQQVTRIWTKNTREESIVNRHSQQKLFFHSTSCKGQEKHAFLEKGYNLSCPRFFFFSWSLLLCFHFDKLSNVSLVPHAS